MRKICPYQIVMALLFVTRCPCQTTHPNEPYAEKSGVATENNRAEATKSAAKTATAALRSKDCPIASGSELTCAVKSRKLSELDVMAFGAKGDCTPSGPIRTCTDNTKAIQAAIDAANAMGGAVLLSPNPASSGQTVYYVSGTLNPKGVSIRGVSGSGIGTTGLAVKVNVRGAPGKDVFAPGDPTSDGYVAPNPSFVWQDFGIVVDDSIDASASFTHRKPGKTCNDITVTNRSAKITTAGECVFVQGDVGQSVTLTDGANTVSGTIASVLPYSSTANGGNTATISSKWPFSSGDGRTLYVSVMRLSTNARVGNCALAYDDTSSNNRIPGVLNSVFRNLNIATTSGKERNNSCAFFFQGTRGQVYASRFENIASRSQWGFVAAVSDKATGTQNSGLGDTNHFSQWFMEAAYPWVTYDGSWNDWEGGQIADAIYGPQILDYGDNGGLNSYVAFWTIKNMEFEPAGTSGGGWRISGVGHKVENSYIASIHLTPAQWDASASNCEMCSAFGTVNVTGRLNRFDFSFVGDWVRVNDTGFGNFCRLGRSSNPIGELEPSLYQSCGAANSRQNLAFSRTADFVANGDEQAPYNNQADLWIWAPDLYFNGSTPQVIADSTSESGSNAFVIAAAYSGSLLGRPIIIGPTSSGANFPATEVHVCFKIRADASGSTAYLGLYSPLGTIIAGTGGLISIPTTNAVACFDADLSSLAGQRAWFFDNPGTGSNHILWISVHPWSGEVLTHSTTLGVIGNHAYTKHTTYSFSWTPTAVAANRCAAQSVTVTGVAAGDIVVGVIPPSITTHVIRGEAMITGANVLSVNFCGDSIGGAPAGGTWRIDIER